MRVIGILGHAQSGKTTVSNILSELLPESKQFAFADKIKKIASIAFEETIEQIDNGKTECPSGTQWTRRKILQSIGDFFRSIKPDIFTSLPESWNQIPNLTVIVTDVRFPSEAEYLCKTYNTTIIKIEDKKNKYLENNPLVAQHQSEKYVDTIDYDILIDNTEKDGIDKLKEKVKKMIELYLIK